MEKLSPMVEQYLITALWSSTDDNGNPLDDTYGLEDIEPKSIQQAIEDCDAFLSDAFDLLAGYDLSTAGHDFWLTRNGHGAGFWDGDYGDVGEALTKLSKPYGTVDPVIGEDGKIHLV